MADLAQHVPPHSIEAEQATIGAVLVDRAMFDLVAALIKPAEFYVPQHATIFAAIVDLGDRGRPIDKISVAEELRARGQLERIGGIGVLSACMQTVPTAASAEYYAQIVRDKALLRGLIGAGTAVTRLGYEGEDDPAHALLEAERIVRTVAGGHSPRIRPQTPSELSRVVFDGIEAANTGRASRGQMTPWASINVNTGGFFPGELVVIAASKKTGKSGAILNLLDYVSVHDGDVALISLEMPIVEVHTRLMAMYSGVESRRLRAGRVRGEDFDRFGDAMTALAERRIWYYGRELSRLGDLRRELRLLSREVNLKAVAVDHVGFIHEASNGDRYSTKNDRLDGVYRTLLEVGDELGVVMYAVQHINREGSKKSRPTAEDIRDGGNPEGHANTVLLLHRPNPQGTDDERQQGEFIIAACRDGIEGPIEMRYDGARHLWLEPNVVRPWFEMDAPTEQDLFAERSA